MKRTLWSASLAGTSLALLTTAVHAQTCLGGAPFTQQTAQIGTEVSRSNGASAATAGGSVGDTHGTFGSLALGRIHENELHDNAAVFSARAGHGLSVSSDPQTELCPFVSAVIINGADLPTGESLSSREFGAGFGVGTRLPTSSGFEVTPFASGAYVLETATIRLNGPPTAIPDDHYLNTVLGIGFLIQQAFTVTPSLGFAIAHGETARSYGLRLSFSFGRVKLHPPAAPGEGSLATVWVNPRALLYYCSGSESFGGTAGGSFMTERDALAAGYTPDRGQRCGQ